ncbi:AIPR family protein [Ruminiclostridium cellobioparum]|uniref:AIPR protein n=1 Tax=Ruminiclostridium cellobioparum subsp. termitidis CT1112 TaxID=1195236 RepID=S0FQ36_RUMCE|nr:AIPR family protein [Ruminiclostridium cellobioparum]EMS70603.1 AIPR protein [Ruminiclostridium cellobioparum subsp. termitidis CT1112]
MENLTDFAKSFVEDVLSQADADVVLKEDAFTDIFCGYLVSAEQCMDYVICNFKKSVLNIKINAYEYNEYFGTFTLVISDFDQFSIMSKMNSKLSDSLFRRARNFFEKSCKGLKNKLEDSTEAFALSDIIETNQRNIDKLKIIIITNKIATNEIPSDSNIESIGVSHDIWDIERIYQLLYQQKGPEEIRIKIEEIYGESLGFLKTDDDNEIYDSYVGIIPGKLLAKIYDDWGQRLIERNVRSFLQAKGTINRGLRDTINKDPRMFMAYNNGISTIAEQLVLNPSPIDNYIQIKEMVGWQIVNGGQTTASLYNALKSKADLDSVYLQMKLTVIKKEEHVDDIITSISKYANSQNKITMSDFSANDNFHVTMENLSRRVWVPSVKGKATTKWFYERARGQYLVELNRQHTESKKRLFKQQNPKNQVMNKTAAAKYEMSWLQFPHIVSRGAETNFVFFTDMVKDKPDLQPNEDYFKHLVAKAILFSTCDKIVKNNNFGDYKANVVTYTIGLLSSIRKGKIDFDTIWANQSLDKTLCAEISDLSICVWKHITKPIVEGTNITQWCKREECWTELIRRYKSNEL